MISIKFIRFINFLLSNFCATCIVFSPLILCHKGDGGLSHNVVGYSFLTEHSQIETLFIYKYDIHLIAGKVGIE